MTDTEIRNAINRLGWLLRLNRLTNRTNRQRHLTFEWFKLQKQLINRSKAA